jgi:cytochrome c oxidase cbb3-type subunit I/II
MLAILGVSGLSLVAFSLLIMPAISAASTNIRRGNWLQWLAVEGAAFQVIALYVAGRTQAFSWNQLNDLGRLEYPEFVNAIAWVEPMWIVVAFGASAWLLAMLAWLTLLLKMVLSTNGLPATIPKGASSESTDPITVPSRLVDAPVLGVAIGLEQWTQLTWHAAIERSIGKLATRIGAGLAIGTLLFWLPSFLVRGLDGNASSVTQSPYTELELIGREIYVREGCVSCHSQATRPLVPEVLRYGSFSQATDYAFDRPTQIGFRRVGPDLAREGGRQTSLWHWQHLENPQSMTPESVMPAFDYLLSKPLEFGKSEVIVRQAELVAADIVSQGGPVIHDDNLLMNSSGIALIAYLQRLGMVTTSSPPMENKTNE